MRLFIVALMFSVFACQVSENDNYHVYKPDPSTEPFAWPIIGTWHNPDQSLVITESELSCGAKMANIIYIGQKYFQLEQEVCGLTYAVPWTSYPPHDILKLWAEGKHIIYYRQQ